MRKFLEHGAAVGALAFIFGLSACGENQGSNPYSEAPDGAEATCQSSISGGDTLVTEVNTSNDLIGCTNCGASDIENAIDGDPETAAYLYAEGATDRPEHGKGLRVIAQEGVVFPAGTYAGAFVSFPEPVVSGSVYVQTLLDGVVQNGELLRSSLILSSSGKETLLIATDKPYNMVEVIVSPAGVSDTGTSDETYLRPGVGRIAVNLYDFIYDECGE